MGPAWVRVGVRSSAAAMANGARCFMGVSFLILLTT